MEISYLAPCKGSLRITVTPFHHLQPGNLPTSSHRHSRSSDYDDLTFDPVSNPVDTFRVLIRGRHGEDGESHKGNKKKSNQIYAQGMIILY